MFPDKARMVRSANMLWLILTVAPVLYLVTAAIVTYGKPGLARDENLILPLFIGLLVASIANIGFTVFIQTSKNVMQIRAGYDPIGRVFLRMSTGSVLSEAHSIYGLVLTLLSGSILYGIGFSLISWASLLWVRGRFKQNLAKLPDPPPYQTS